jgi:hypothetical protein
MSDCELL